MSCEGAKHTNLVQTPLVNNRVISLKQCGNQCTSDKYLLVLKGIFLAKKEATIKIVLFEEFLRAALRPSTEQSESVTDKFSEIWVIWRGITYRGLYVPNHLEVVSDRLRGTSAMLNMPVRCEHYILGKTVKCDLSHNINNNK